MKASAGLLIWWWMLVSALVLRADSLPRPDAAVQVIQQASDPSTVVAAYANGFALDRNDPKLHSAYVARMVELGLPELAYRQAQVLVGLDASNGLGWGVIALVDAKRGQMTDAISSIVLAAKLSSDNYFIQRTAGDMFAWYDVQGSQLNLTNDLRDSVANVRASLGPHKAFTDAYNAARKVYESQPRTAQPPAGAAPQAVPAVPKPQSYVTPGIEELPPPDVVYVDQPYPPPSWYYPSGYFYGCDFFPVFGVIACDRFHHRFHHHHHHHDGFIDPPGTRTFTRVAMNSSTRVSGSTIVNTSTTVPAPTGRSSGFAGGPRITTMTSPTGTSGAAGSSVTARQSTSTTATGPISTVHRGGFTIHTLAPQSPTTTYAPVMTSPAIHGFAGAPMSAPVQGYSSGVSTPGNGFTHSGGYSGGHGGGGVYASGHSGGGRGR